MHALVPLGAGEAGEIPGVLLHPRAEPRPEVARVVLGHGRAVDQHRQAHTTTWIPSSMVATVRLISSR